MRKIKLSLLLFLLLLCNSKNIVAQTNIDSLTKRLEIIKDNKERVETLNNLAWALKYSDVDKAMEYANKSLDLAKTDKDNEGLAFAYRTLMAINIVVSDNKKASYYGNLGLEVAQKYNIKYEEAKILNIFSIIAREDFKYTEALDYSNKSLQIWRELNDLKEQAGVLNNIGIIYTHINDGSKALEIYYQIILIEEKLNNKEGLARTYNCIGSIFNRYGNYKKAIEYYNNAITICIEINNTLFEAANYNDIANAYSSLEQDSIAKIFYFKAIDINTKLDKKFWIAKNYQNLALIEIKHKKYNLAIDLLEKSTAITIEIADSIGLGVNYFFMSSYYYEIKDYEKSIKYAKLGYQVNEIVGSLDIKANCAKQLYLSFKKMGQFKNAVDYIDYFIKLSDSLNNIKKADLVLELNTKFETDKKEHENIILKNENEIKNTTIQKQFLIELLIIIAFLFSVFIGIIIYRSKKKGKNEKIILENKNKQISEQKEEIEKQKEEIMLAYDKLKELDSFKENMTSMLVHDLKNPLGNIINVKELGQTNNKMDIIQQSGKQMLNLVLNILDVYKYANSKMNLNKETVSINNIVELAFKDVQHLASKNNIKFINKLKADVFLFVDKEIVQRIFVNLFVNAIKFSHLNGTVTIEDESYNKKGFLKIKITDTGDGIPKEKLSSVFVKYGQVVEKKSGDIPSTGLGLSFCKMAIESHGGNIGVESEINKETTFWFTLPSLEKINSETFQKETNLNYDFVFEKPILTKEEIATILPYIEKLKKHEVFEFSIVNEELKKIEAKKIEKLKIWLAKIQSTLYSCNQDKYTELINVFNENTK